MDPSQNSKWYINLETTAPCYHQQGASTSTTVADSVMLRMLSASTPETAFSNNSDLLGIASVAPMVSENLRQMPVSTQNAVQSFLYNTSKNVRGTVDMGFPNVPLAAGPSSMSSVSDLPDPLGQNSQRQMLDKLQSANLLSLLGSQFPSFPIRPATPTQGLTSTCPSPQLVQASSTSFLATLMQQMLCSSLNANAAPVAPAVPPPMNNSNLVTQLIAQLLTAQLAQSAQAGPVAGLLQVIQALGSMAGSASAATPFQASSQTSILSHLSSLDPAAAKQVILMLVNQLVQSGNLVDDATCQRFVEKLQASPCCSPWQQTQSAARSNWQAVQNMSALNSASPKNVPFAPKNIKKETISSADRDGSDGFMVPVIISASPSPRSTCDGAGVIRVGDATHSTEGVKVDTPSEQSDAGMSSGESIVCQTQQRTHANGSHGNSRKPAKHPRGRTISAILKSAVSIKDDGGTTGLEAAGKCKPEHNLKEMEKIDFVDRTEPSDKHETSGKRLRSRSKTVRYCDEELTNGLELSDSDTDLCSKKKKKSDSRAHSNSQNSDAKETKKTRSVSCSLTQSSSIAADVASCGNASNSQAVVKNEITGPISVLPMVNICHSPNVRYLFMGRKNDGMDWLNLVSYKTPESEDFVNQCLFCPMISSDVKPVADHIANEHGDLDFVLTNIKQPTGRITYLACRHCNFVTFEPTLMWIHFELYHGIPGIMDGSSLPQINIGDPVNVEEISLDKPVNSEGCQPAYVCLDCMLCSNNSKNIAMHVVQAHPDTVNFNGCFVKLMMIKTKEKDSFTFREALYDESHADALKDVYICMLCEYSTHGAYLAMSHSLRLHQTKRLLLMCNKCDYQCIRETSLMTHMSSSHQCSSISSLMCSVTLIATLPDGTFIECKIPVKWLKTDHSNSSSDCEMKPSRILQSTAVSSSQEKRKLLVLNEREESTVAPQSNCKMVLLDKKVNTN